jgi:N4-(beta-N-acetylglucosaminyl)-L-asparaginase
MRRGKHPKDACMEALKRVKANTVEKRLLTDKGLPNFYLTFYAVDRQGRFAGADLYSTSRGGKPRQFAVHTENGPQILPVESLLGEGLTADE